MGGRDRPTRVILGISCDYHDAAAALVVDGELVAAAEEERFSRVQHDRSLPRLATEACLRTAGVGVGDVDAVAFYERPLDLVGRFVASRQRQGPRGLWSFTRDLPSLVRTQLMIGHRIAAMFGDLGAPVSPRLHFVDHHRSHAAAAFLPSPFEHAAILTVDGIGEWATASIGVGNHHRIELIEEMRYPDSLGLLYSFVTMYCGMQPNRDEYKLMGLAPYGDPSRFAAGLADLARVLPDGSLDVRADRIRWYEPTSSYRRGLERSLGGPPRIATDPLTLRDADLAAAVQSLTETAMLNMAGHARRLTGEPLLCMAGGVALNSVANGRLLRESPFDEIWIQPAASDSGSAVGAALHVWHEICGHHRDAHRPDAMSGAFLGPRALPREVDDWVRRSGLRTQRFEHSADLSNRVAHDLADGAAVGWFTGRMEFGPRALGHRSILADPRSPTVRGRLNAAVKLRESYRPFAPAVLAEHSSEWFDLDHPSPYMLFVAQVAGRRLVDHGPEPDELDERSALVRSEIPACTHVDGSSRVQTVDREQNPEFHQLLSAFNELTGCPVLLNTSFNRSGQPIVANPDEALATARAAGLDVLVVEHHVIPLVDEAAPSARSERIAESR